MKGPGSIYAADVVRGLARFKEVRSRLIQGVGSKETLVCHLLKTEPRTSTPHSLSKAFGIWDLLSNPIA